MRRWSQFLEGEGTTDDTSATAGEQSFGTLESPCGQGDATGATDQGVTDTSITIGYGDDAGYAASPGLNHQMSDAMKSFVDWCNQQGGILGRQVVAEYYDAKITEVGNVMTEACAKVFVMVGQGFVLDSAQEATRRGCGLPSVPAFAVSPAHTNGPLMWTTTQVPVDYWNTAPAAQFQKLFPDKIGKSAIMYANYAATIDTKEKILSTFPEFGGDFLDCPVEYNIAGEPDWKPFIQRLKDCGAEVVYFVGNPYPNFENALEAAAQLDYDPIWMVTGNFYDNGFRDWNTSGFGDNVYMGYTFTPFEEVAYSPATQQYMDMLAEERRRHQPARDAGGLELPDVGDSVEVVRFEPDPGVCGRLPRHGHVVGRRWPLATHEPWRQPSGRVRDVVKWRARHTSG